MLKVVKYIDGYLNNSITDHSYKEARDEISRIMCKQLSNSCHDISAEDLLDSLILHIKEKEWYDQSRHEREKAYYLYNIILVYYAKYCWVCWGAVFSNIGRKDKYKEMNRDNISLSDPIIQSRLIEQSPEDGINNSFVIELINKILKEEWFQNIDTINELLQSDPFNATRIYSEIQWISMNNARYAIKRQKKRMRELYMMLTKDI